MKNNLEELKATLEEIRSSKYPDIPKEIVEKIVEAQNNFQDTPTERKSETEKIIFEYVNSLSSKGGAV